jgi:chemotaxis protein methyltransferase CheR
VRGQVCRRINKRLQELELEDYDAYKYYLEKHPIEWQKTDGMTHITISRFFRDKKQWDVLERDILRINLITML